MRSALLLAGYLLAAVSVTAQAQEMGTMQHGGGYQDAHARAFTSGDPKGWTIGAPHLDIAGGYYHIGGEQAGDNSAAFIRAHAQFSIGSPVIQIASDIQFLPKFTGANPTISAVAQLAPIKTSSPLFLAAGIGLISGHNGDRMAGWLQATAAIRTPLHAITIFGQIGKSLVSGSKGELLLGVQHPLAPYKFHGLKG
ncbi:MAG: hypothetical protein V4503_08120 [Gemmatimonadota bacterium]